mmetsp:Transcript_68671/g.198903  ORF Transcript_68671/g.198903 Transcript_68671/m.198903 type:complete len:210 (+) Transcript_68671:667-1296(+)
MVDVLGEFHQRLFGALLGLQQPLQLHADLREVVLQAPGDGGGAADVAPGRRAGADTSLRRRGAAELGHEAMLQGCLRGEAFGGPLLAEPANGVKRVGVEPLRREAEVNGQDEATCRLLARRTEWRLARQQLVEENAHVPHVHGLVMPRAHDHLWREVIQCAAEGVALVRFDEVGPTEIRQLDVVLTVEEDVLGFDVAVDDLLWQPVQIV